MMLSKMKWILLYICLMNSVQAAGEKSCSLILIEQEKVEEDLLEFLDENSDTLEVIYELDFSALGSNFSLDDRINPAIYRPERWYRTNGKFNARLFAHTFSNLMKSSAYIWVKQNYGIKVADSPTGCLANVSGYMLEELIRNFTLNDFYIHFDQLRTESIFRTDTQVCTQYIQNYNESDYTLAYKCCGNDVHSRVVCEIVLPEQLMAAAQCIFMFIFFALIINIPKCLRKISNAIVTAFSLNKDREWNQECNVEVDMNEYTNQKVKRLLFVFTHMWPFHISSIHYLWIFFGFNLIVFGLHLGLKFHNYDIAYNIYTKMKERNLLSESFLMLRKVKVIWIEIAICLSFLYLIVLMFLPCKRNYTLLSEYFKKDPMDCFLRSVFGGCKGIKDLIVSSKRKTQQKKRYYLPLFILGILLLLFYLLCFILRLCTQFFSFLFRSPLHVMFLDEVICCHCKKCATFNQRSESEKTSKVDTCKLAKCCSFCANVLFVLLEIFFYLLNLTCIFFVSFPLLYFIQLGIISLSVITVKFAFLYLIPAVVFFLVMCIRRFRKTILIEHESLRKAILEEIIKNGCSQPKPADSTDEAETSTLAQSSETSDSVTTHGKNNSSQTDSAGLDEKTKNKDIYISMEFISYNLRKVYDKIVFHFVSMVIIIAVIIIMIVLLSKLHKMTFDNQFFSTIFITNLPLIIDEMFLKKYERMTDTERKTILSRSFDLYEGVIYIQIDVLDTSRNQDNADLNRNEEYKLHNLIDKQISEATEDTRSDTNLHSATETTPLCAGQPRVSNGTF